MYVPNISPTECETEAYLRGSAKDIGMERMYSEAERKGDRICRKCWK